MLYMNLENETGELNLSLREKKKGGQLTNRLIFVLKLYGGNNYNFSYDDVLVYFLLGIVEFFFLIYLINLLW